MIYSEDNLKKLLVGAFEGVTSKENIIGAIDEVIDGSYEKHEACYNCRRDAHCKYRNRCRISNNRASLSYFEKK